MRFTAQEARAITIESITKSLGEDKIKLIIEEIREQAQAGYWYFNIDYKRYNIDEKDRYLIGHWAELNGYKVVYPRNEVISISWNNVK